MCFVSGDGIYVDRGSLVVVKQEPHPKLKPQGNHLIDLRGRCRLFECKETFGG